MKQTLLLLIFSTLFLGCDKTEIIEEIDPEEKCLAKHFYFGRGEKIQIGNLFEDQFVHLGFYSTYTVSKIDSLLNTIDYFQEDTLNAIKNRSNMHVYLKNLKVPLSCIEKDSLIAVLEKEAMVAFASHTYSMAICNALDSICEGVGSYGNEIVLRFNENTNREQLDSLCIATHSWVSSISPYGTYVISTDKNSQSNALELANYFYETDLFAYASPNFYTYTFIP